MKNLLVTRTTALLCALLLCGCSNAQDTSANLDNTETTTNDTQTTQYADNVTYSGMMFEISLPKELADIAEVETLDNQINVYFKESKDAGFGGLAFFICAFESPEEYAGGPFEKVGELSNQDAEIYDVVKGYATEIQWDYNDPSMPEGYGKLYDAADSVIESMKGVDGFTYSHGAGTKGEDLYNNPLSEYVKNGEDIETIGYAYADTNVDGIDELYVGEITDGDSKGAAFDIYSMVNHTPTLVISGDETNRFYNYDDCLVSNEWGDDKTYGVDIYNIEPNTTEMLYQRGFKYDSVENPENPWFLSYDGEEYESISEEEFTSGVEEIRGNYILFDFKPLSENTDAIEAANL